jgi:hypothetical protein
MLNRKFSLGVLGLAAGMAFWAAAPVPAAAFVPAVPALQQDLSGGQVEQAYHRRHWRWHHRHHNRHCWRGRYGRLHCRWW